MREASLSPVAPRALADVIDVMVEQQGGAKA